MPRVAVRALYTIINYYQNRSEHLCAMQWDTFIAFRSEQLGFSLEVAMHDLVGNYEVNPGIADLWVAFRGHVWRQIFQFFPFGTRQGLLTQHVLTLYDGRTNRVAGAECPLCRFKPNKCASV